MTALMMGLDNLEAKNIIFTSMKFLGNRELLLYTLIMLVSTILLGLFAMPIIRRLHVGQIVRSDGPKTHYAKSGTPTFGAIFFLLPLLIIGFISVFIYYGMWTNGMILVFTLLFAIVGFMDDYIKVRVSREGMSVRQKTVLLGILSLLAAIYFSFIRPGGAFILLPFSLRRIDLLLGGKIIYCLILTPFLFYMSNSVNITDGLDGLLSGLMAIASFFLFVTARLLIQQGILPAQASFLQLLIMAGCIGFLFFNRHPARVFMGDTGSQSLGIAFTLLTVAMGLPYLAIITGFVFFFEGFSVVLQTIYFRKTGGQRIFKMAPIHHHFELKGWPETKVVRVFYLVGFAVGFIGLLFVYGAW